MRILVADDELISRVIVRRAIKNYYSGTAAVVEAADGEEAVEKAKAEDVDVVLMDIEMPGMDGMEAARQIKAWKSGCEVIFLTAFADFQYAKEAISIGASEYLVKPVDPEELKRVLEHCREKMGIKEEEEKREPFSDEEDANSAVSQPEPEAGMLTGRAAMITMQVKQYIELHYMDDLAMDQLAEQFGISINYLNRIFRSSCGMSGKEYLIHVRVNQAREYLKNPALNIREVGLMVGYGDSNYFTRIFKKKTGMTPVEYRNQQFFGL